MNHGNPQAQQEIGIAFQKGLEAVYGNVWGSLYGEVARYRAGNFLDLDNLRKEQDTGAAPVLEAIVTGRITSATMLAIRSLMIGAALLDQRDAVLRWATTGADRARILGGDWAQTEAQWQAVLDKPDQFIFTARQIKYFLMQI